MTKDEALKLALEALEGADMIDCDMREAITAIKEALAQPEQEPVAWIYSQGTAKVPSMSYVSGVRATPLYTSPPAHRTWVGLTDGEIEVIEALKAPPVHPDFIDCDDWMDFARAIEFKLKEKNELR